MMRGDLSSTDDARRLNSPPLQAHRVGHAPGMASTARGAVDPVRGRGWGLSANTIAELNARASKMRKNPTEPEKRLWRVLSGAQLSGHKFRRQAVVGRFIADFLCPQKAPIIEVDGDTHDEAKDRLRDDLLTEHGYRVVRVTNLDVMSNLEGVFEFIGITLHETPDRWDRPHPNPSPEGEGLKKNDNAQN